MVNEPIDLHYFFKHCGSVGESVKLVVLNGLLTGICHWYFYVLGSKFPFNQN